MNSSDPAPTIAELRAMLKTLVALAADRRFVDDLDPRLRGELFDAARHLLDVPARTPRPSTPLPPEVPAPRVVARRPCYVCLQTIDVDVDALCAPCRAVEQATAHALEQGRVQQVLADRVVVVTGGRTNIGYATALAALRLGARVLVTTRFVDDARTRYRGEADVETWWDRLSVDALDLRDLPAIERLAARWGNEVEGIDAVIHNAAQTLPLSLSTQRALLTGPSSLRALPSPAVLTALASVSPTPLTTCEHDDDGPYGRAPAASWHAGIADVSTRELLEVLLVNAAAPFVFTRALLPLLKRSARRPQIVVNVTSNEGRFSFARDDDTDTRASDVRSERNGKSHRHPHLNMAKAALNMMTRTSAAELFVDGVVLVGVDPGWVSGPLPVGGFATGRFPLDVDEAARRILQPVVAAAHGQPPRRGVLYKNWRPSPW